MTEFEVILYNLKQLRKEQNRLRGEQMTISSRIIEAERRLRQVCPHTKTNTVRQDRSKWHQPEYYMVTICETCRTEVEVKRV